jgi:hypothetical protein
MILKVQTIIKNTLNNLNQIIRVFKLLVDISKYKKQLFLRTLDNYRSLAKLDSEIIFLYK